MFDRVETQKIIKEYGIIKDKLKELLKVNGAIPLSLYREYLTVIEKFNQRAIPDLHKQDEFAEVPKSTEDRIDPLEINSLHA